MPERRNTEGKGRWKKRADTWQDHEFNAVMNALEQAFDDEDYPMSKSRLAARASTVNVTLDTAVPLVKYVEGIPDQRYRSVSDVKDALTARWQKLRALRGAGAEATTPGEAPIEYPAARSGAPSHAGKIVGDPRPPYHGVGVSKLSPLLEYVDFPATRGDVAARIGDYRVPVSRERTRSVRSILEHEGIPDAFPTSRHLERAVSEHWDEIAEPDSADVSHRGSRHVPRDDVSGRPHRG
jgi:hypothetical protein